MDTTNSMGGGQYIMSEIIIGISTNQTIINIILYYIIPIILMFVIKNDAVNKIGILVSIIAMITIVTMELPIIYFLTSLALTAGGLTNTEL